MTYKKKGGRRNNLSRAHVSLSLSISLSHTHTRARTHRDIACGVCVGEHHRARLYLFSFGRAKRKMGRKTLATPSGAASRCYCCRENQRERLPIASFPESLNWLQSRREYRDKAKSLREDVMKLRKENEVSFQFFVCDISRYFQQQQQQQQHAVTLACSFARGHAKDETEMLLLRAQILELDKKEKKEKDRTQNCFERIEDGTRRKKTTTSTEKLKGKLFELQTARKKH